MMSLVTLIPVFMLALTFGNAWSSVTLKADDFCVNDILKYNSSCRIYAEDETVIRDLFENIRKRKSLIITHMSFNSKLMDFDKGNLVLPMRWLIATTKLGRKFLMIKLYFESLSLTTLSFSVKHLNIPLLESPSGCLSNRSPGEYETMMRKLYFCGLNASFAKEYENEFEDHVFVCSLHRQVYGGTYEENFHYVCCDKTGDNILCMPVEDDYIVFVFKHIYRIALMVVIALFCPHVMIVIIDICIPERKKFTVVECRVLEDPCISCGRKMFEFEPGVSVSSALDIYSLNGLVIVVLSRTIDLLMFATFNRFKRATIRSIIVFIYKLLILAFFVFGMIVHYSDNLYYLDYRLYVVMICVLSSFTVCVLLWIVSFCLHITSNELEINFSAMMSHLRYGYKAININSMDQESTVLKKVGIYLVSRVPIFSIIASLLMHRKCENCFPPHNERKMWIRLFMFILTFCAMFLYISYFQFVLGMLFDVILFTLIGIVVNPEEVYLYVAIPLFILFYAHHCFGTVYEEFKNYFNVVLKHICQLLDRKYLHERETTEEIMLMNTCFRFSENNIPVIFFDDTGMPKITKSLFFKACVMRCYGCPGSQWRKFGAATFLFLCWLFSFGFVVVLVLTFGDNYGISKWSQFLGTLAGGFLPLIFRLILTRNKSEDYSDYMYDMSTFQSQLKNLLTDHKEHHIREIIRDHNLRTVRHGDFKSPIT